MRLNELSPDQLSGIFGNTGGLEEEEEKDPGFFSSLRTLVGQSLNDPWKAGAFLARLPADIVLSPDDMVRKSITDPTG